MHFYQVAFQFCLYLNLRVYNIFEPMKCPTKIRVDFLCKWDLEYTSYLGSFHKNKIKNIWVEFSKNESIQHVRVTFSKNEFGQDCLKAT